MIKARSAAAVCHRRRGSVLVLVMTLLGILFVTGVAFLASMNFEAEVVAIERGRDRRDVGIEAVLDETVSTLRGGLVGDGGAPFGGSLDEPLSRDEFGVAPAVLGEMPGVHDLFAPIEPYQDANTGEFRYRSYTDLPSVMGRGDDKFKDTLARRRFIGEVNVAWASGRQVPGPTGPDLPIPVDSDGDGVTDTFQFSVSGLGFSKAQVAELSSILNPSSNPDGDVFLGMRVIAHGGMVNLNESHPTLISNILDLPPGYELTLGPIGGELEFNHRPSTLGVKYSPQLEEPVLRRRGLLPPRRIAPSLLHGNALLDSSKPGQELGLADMPTKLFPTDPNGDPEESVFEGAHRYFPFDGLNEEYDPNTPLWPARMEPFASFNADGTGNAYDRRHLVTTVSHDDLLSRGGRVVSKFNDAGVPIADIELREAMIQVNCSACQASSGFPFEYADYPQDMEPGGCAALADPSCRLNKLNARKGRLALSLAWLDENFPCEDPVLGVGDRAECMLRRSRMIQDVFMMLLRNARGAYWDEISCTTNMALCDNINELCDTTDPDPNNWQCYDPVTGLSHRESLISRTAASLTANLIDYMDAEDFDGDGFDDGLPTRVALRSFDFSDPDTVGRELGPPTNPGMPQQYVFGLERQPYITEVTTVAEGDPAVLTAWAVELYNPYDQAISNVFGSDDYYLVPIDPSVAIAPDDAPPLGGFRITTGLTVVGPGAFTVVLSGSTAKFGNVTQGEDGRIKTVTDLKFKKGWILYLVRRVQVANDPQPTNIVVDQFTVDGQNIGVEPLSPEIMGTGPGPYIFSQERFIPDPSPPLPDPPQSRWTATVPDATDLPPGVQTLGKWSAGTGTKPMPVEVNFANTGSFTGFDPVRGAAFPTTGSMLLLMRHANRQFADRSITTTTRDAVTIDFPTEALAFTARLDDQVGYAVQVEDPPGSGIWGTLNGTIDERKQVDNGRMPVFDTVFVDTLNPQAGRRFAHHIDPALDPSVFPPKSTVDRPGGTEHLPWGQLLWDYFTVLPLRSQGPYPAWDGPDPPYTPAAADSIPRVDLDGLRVHGRININAAPWMVMGGLPLVPMNRIPESFRNKIGTLRAGRRAFAGLGAIPDTEADQLVVDQGMAIVAYRDARSIEGSGDYGGGDPSYHRGWELAGPAVRRGTGFITVGELANVRHPNALDKLYRMDFGELGEPEPDYVKAVALLASLGDWVTVRSHVFTTYGTLRGEGDVERFPDDEVERAKDVDRRAVRFQETVDRLPTLLGASKPTRIGQRYVGPYIDVRND